MEITYTQCKQLAKNYPRSQRANSYRSELRDAVEQMRDQPEWLSQSKVYHNSETGATRTVRVPSRLSIADIQAIQQGGCASGAYMPAVTYWQALETMDLYGDDVLAYIEDALGELPPTPHDASWSQLACFYLSHAVELWCWQFDLDGVDWD